MLKKELCIVLKKIRFLERDLMITALSPSLGKVSAHAKNALQSRRFGGCFDLFCLSEWEYMQKESSDIIRVDRAEIKKSFTSLEKSWEQFSVASFITEIILQTASSGESSESIFQLYINTLLAIEKTSNPYELLVITNSYLYKVLQWHGIQPALQYCLNCNKKYEEINLSDVFLAEPRSGGWHCSSCASQTKQKYHDFKSQDSLHFSYALKHSDIELLIYLGKTPVKQIDFNLLGSPKQKDTALFEFLLSMTSYHTPQCELTKLKTISFLPFGNLRFAHLHDPLSGIKKGVRNETLIQ